MIDLPIPVLVLSETGNIEHLNREAENQFYPIFRKLLGQGIEVLGDRLARGVHRAKQNRGDVIVRDVSISHVDGVMRWDAIICKRAEQEKLQLLLMPTASHTDDGTLDLAQFAHILSHEIKNPLAGISGASQMLRRSLPADADMSMVNIIDDEVKRVGRLIDRLSNFELFNAPRPTLENVHAALEQVVAAEKAAFGQDVNYEKIYDPSLPQIYIDKDHIQEAVQNLLRNAVEALMSAEKLLAPPKITIKTGLKVGHSRRSKDKRSQPMIEIRIEDNGPGIPPEAQKAVFGAFQSTKAKGRGLGLAIVKEIVTAHDGWLELVSHVGVTRFSIILPMFAKTSDEANSNSTGK